jgi:hypothetical protein
MAPLDARRYGTLARAVYSSPLAFPPFITIGINRTAKVAIRIH